LKLIVGLGNPGREYQYTRHNIGFMVIDVLAERHGIGITRKEKKNLLGKGNINSEKIIIAKPQTFMNLSGEAIGPLFSTYIDDIEDLIVVHDDLDIEFGKIKIKVGGGHGGHNGLRSIISHLGNDFVRIRGGIGRPSSGHDVSSYVLNRFSAVQKEKLNALTEKLADAIEVVLTDGVKSAMNRFN